jgi:hypothetical protein
MQHHVQRVPGTAPGVAQLLQQRLLRGLQRGLGMGIARSLHPLAGGSAEGLDLRHQGRLALALQPHQGRPGRLGLGPVRLHAPQGGVQLTFQHQVLGGA